MIDIYIFYYFLEIFQNKRNFILNNIACDYHMGLLDMYKSKIQYRILVILFSFILKHFTIRNY